MLTISPVNFISVKNSQQNTCAVFQSQPKSDIVSFSGKVEMKELKTFLERFPNIFKDVAKSDFTKDERGFYASIPYDLGDFIANKYNDKRLKDYYDIIRSADVGDLKGFLKDLIKHKGKFSHQVNYLPSEKKFYIIQNKDNIIAGASELSKLGSLDLRKNNYLFSFLSSKGLSGIGNLINVDEEYYIIQTISDMGKIVGISADKVKKIK